jgi:hypothetical protein
VGEPYERAERQVIPWEILRNTQIRESVEGCRKISCGTCLLLGICLAHPNFASKNGVKNGLQPMTGII